MVLHLYFFLLIYTRLKFIEKSSIVDRIIKWEYQNRSVILISLCIVQMDKYQKKYFTFNRYFKRINIYIKKKKNLMFNCFECSGECYLEKTQIKNIARTIMSHQNATVTVTSKTNVRKNNVIYPSLALPDITTQYNQLLWLLWSKYTFWLISMH